MLLHGLFHVEQHGLLFLCFLQYGYELLVANVAKPEALAFIFAITFNMPCIVALAATYQETHSAKWTTLIALYYTIGALLIACAAYHIGLLIW